MVNVKTGVSPEGCLVLESETSDRHNLDKKSQAICVLLGVVRFIEGLLLQLRKYFLFSSSNTLIHGFDELYSCNKLNPPILIFTRKPRSVEIIDKLNWKKTLIYLYIDFNSVNILRQIRIFKVYLLKVNLGGSLELSHKPELEENRRRPGLIYRQPKRVSSWWCLQPLRHSLLCR